MAHAQSATMYNKTRDMVRGIGYRFSASTGELLYYVKGYVELLMLFAALFDYTVCILYMYTFRVACPATHFVNPMALHATNRT